MKTERSCAIEPVCNLKRRGEPCLRQVCDLEDVIITGDPQKIREVAEAEVSKLSKRAGESYQRWLGMTRDL